MTDKKEPIEIESVEFEQIVQNSPGHVYWKNRAGVYLGCNMKQAKDLGFKDPRQLIGKTDFDLLDADDAENVRKNDLEVINSGKAIVVEEHTEAYGKPAIYLSHKTPLLDKNGEIIGILGVSLDMTKQKENSKNEKTSDGFSSTDFEQIVKNTPGHVYWKDVNGTYLGCNLEQAKSFGFDNPKDVIGKNDFDLLTPDVAPVIWKNDQEVMKSKKTLIIEEEAVMLGEKGIWLSHKTPLFDSKGEVTGILGVSLNITKQKEQKKAEILESQEGFGATDFEQIVKNTPGHVYWKDKNGFYLGCNLEQARSLGFDDPKKIIGKNDFDLVQKDEAIRIKKNDLEVITSKKTLVVQEEAVLQGKNAIYLSHKTPLFDSKGEVAGVLGISLDITKQLEFARKGIEKLTRARLINVPLEDRQYLKARTCIFPVSVGRDDFEDRRLKATLETINSSFKECTIAICDTLQRYTLEIENPEKSEQELYELSLLNGDQWLDRNRSIIESCIKIPYKIIRWQDYLKSPKFKEYLKESLDFYYSDDKYRAVVKEAINSFLERRGKKNCSDEIDTCFETSLKYLMEEYAVSLGWMETKFDYHIYPNIDDVLTRNFKNLSLKKNQKIINQVGIKFSKVESEFKSNFSEFALNEVINTLPGHVYWKDKNGAFMGSNLQQARLFGFKDSKSLIGKTDFDLADHNIAMNVRNNDLHVMDSKKLQITEEEAELSGKKYTFLSHKTPLKSEKGEIIGILGVSLDITKQKELEQELIIKNKQLSDAIEAKQKFLNNMSHEIRTPLSCILKMSNLLYDDWEKYPSDQARKAHLKLAVDGNNRLQSVLLNLLDLSKANAGKMKYEKSEYSLKQSAKDVFSEFIDQQHRINIKYVGDDEFIGFYDHFRIEQVIRNLLANAISYGGKRDIDITISSESDKLKFKVSDHGVGIPEKELNEIFKIFFQSSATDNNAGGTGIGLSICKSIIEDHDGKIWAENNKDVGCSFIFELPIVRGKTTIAAPEKKSPATNLAPITKETKEKPVILVIDDEQAIRMVSSLVLGSMGFDVMTADGGKQGLEVLAENIDKIDVVLLDMMMPDIHGLEVLKTIKTEAKLKHIPVYIYSGIKNQEEVDKAQLLGASGFIIKTASAEEMKKELAEFLG